jgi:hypothetical protein
MKRRRIGRAVAAAIVVTVLVMIGAAAPASALTKKVDLKLTSSIGCTYHVVGTLHYGPLTTTTFVGTVTVSGDGPGCNGIIVFNQDELGSRTAGRLTATLDTSDLRSLSRITWAGSDRTTAAFLDTDASNRVLCDAIRTAAGR